MDFYHVYFTIMESLSLYDNQQPLSLMIKCFTFYLLHSLPRLVNMDCEIFSEINGVEIKKNLTFFYGNKVEEKYTFSNNLLKLKGEENHAKFSIFVGVYSFHVR